MPLGFGCPLGFGHTAMGAEKLEGIRQKSRIPKLPFFWVLCKWGFKVSRFGDAWRSGFTHFIYQLGSLPLHDTNLGPKKAREDKRIGLQSGEAERMRDFLETSGSNDAGD